MNCDYDAIFDRSDPDCVSTTLFCAGSCLATINSRLRSCRARTSSQVVNCCLCNSSNTGQFMGRLIWDCNTIKSSPSGEYTNIIENTLTHKVDIIIQFHYPQLLYHHQLLYYHRLWLLPYQLIVLLSLLQ